MAVGAAVQGHILAAGDARTGGADLAGSTDLLLLDVTPLSLGIELEGREMSVLIKRNTTIPCRKSRSYTTVEDWQTSIDVVVYEVRRILFFFVFVVSWCVCSLAVLRATLAILRWTASGTCPLLHLLNHLRLVALLERLWRKRGVWLSNVHVCVCVVCPKVEVLCMPIAFGPVSDARRTCLRLLYM